jgi:hypothetical protein
MVLLAGCGELPPSDLGACDYVPGGLTGEIVEPDGSTRPAYDCAGYWRCERGSYLDGLVYPVGSSSELVETAPGVWVVPVEQSSAESQLWCDRCGWAGEPALVLVGGGWYELVSACDWRAR